MIDHKLEIWYVNISTIVNQVWKDSQIQISGHIILYENNPGLQSFGE